MSGMARLDEKGAANVAGGDGAVALVKPVIHVVRLPRTLLLVLGNAARVLCWRGLGRLIEKLWFELEHVQHGEPDRPADRRIRAEPRPEDVAFAIDAESLDDGAVDHEKRGRAGGALPARIAAGAGRLEGLPRGEHHGEVLR